MTFRAAFGLNSCFEVTNLFDDGQTTVINLTTRIGKYEVTIDFPNDPSKLPENMLSDEVKTGEIQPKLFIPLEDLYTCWGKSGQVGQEVMGVVWLLVWCQDNIARLKGKTFWYFLII